MTDRFPISDDNADTSGEHLPDSAPKAAKKPAKPAAEAPEMAHPTAMSHEAGFTSGR